MYMRWRLSSRDLGPVHVDLRFHIMTCSDAAPSIYLTSTLYDLYIAHLCSISRFCYRLCTLLIDSVAGREDKMGVSRITNKIQQIVHKPDISSSPSTGGGDTERQLNVMGDGTYPRATRLQDGSILGVHTSFHGGTNVIVATRSTDEGTSWSPVGEVTRGVGDIDNPFVVQLPTGKVLCAFRNHSKNADGSYAFFRITVCYSNDFGTSWQYLSTPDEVSLWDCS
jgi:hypothetical protein